MKLGIVGTGAIVREVLPQLRAWGWEPAALCGTPRSAESVNALCREHGIADAFTEVSQMLGQAALDAVYIAAPNHLHASLARAVLDAETHVIVEKPLAANDREARTLAELAKRKGLFLFEAISTLYLPIFAKTKALLPRIGQVRLVSCNFSQYSRRYDAFRAGALPPVFDPAKAGGALMDLNVYNLHWLIGLFGAPHAIRYAANLERGIDTGGILQLDYGSFQAVSIAAKDCAAPSRYLIQGTEGWLEMRSPANQCLDVTLHRNDGTEETYTGRSESRLEAEFRRFAALIRSRDPESCYPDLEQSVTVCRLMTEARLHAGVRFPADNPEQK